jgi:hypothetical protein
MTPLVEIGKDGQCVLWQPHLLTEALQARGLDDLALEPALKPACVPGAAMFEVESNETSVRWDWGHWTRVEIRAEQVDGLSAPLNYVRPRHPLIGWNELPASSAVELTFYSADGVAGGCVKIEVPERSVFNRDVSFGQPCGREILVRLLNSKDSTGLSVEWLRLGQREEFKRKGSPIAFPPRASHLNVPIPGDFFGIVAVVRNRDQRRYLIGYAHYNGMKTIPPNLSQTIDEKEFQRVRRWIEGATGGEQQQQRIHQDVTAEEWLDNWPLNSRKRLRHLSEQARRHINLTEGDAYKTLRASPTGLLRYLTLLHFGYESSSPVKIIHLLNEGSFAAALNTALPSLGGALAHLKALEEKIWAVRHANNPNLADAASWAGNQGVAALARALHLSDKRSEALASWEARRVASKTTST